MNKTKLFAIAFLLTYTLTALLCFLSGQPLIYLPKDYSVFGFIQFGALIGFLCFSLVFVNLPILKAVFDLLKRKNGERRFYVLSSLIILQILTLILGYMESKIDYMGSTPFYFYKGVGNSLIYIFTGNLTAYITATLYAKEQIRLKELSKITFEFEGNRPNS